MTDAEALLDATVEHAKELLRIGQALVRAHVEGTPPSEVMLVWSVGRRVGTRVSRVTLWRLRTVLGLVDARGNNQYRARLKPTGRRDTRAAVEGVRP